MNVRLYYEKLISAYAERDFPENASLFDVHIVIPEIDGYGNYSTNIVYDIEKNEVKSINDYLKMDDLADAFNSNKWRGYCYVDNEKIDDPEIAHEVFKETFEPTTHN
ncbi:MAG: hypothetical protein LBS74_00985 [Oscillospiraceae bacterium]|jgi:hypothetical protein|nr:hypothetical protein [Oscillospiraceae bacterium]